MRVIFGLFLVGLLGCVASSTPAPPPPPASPPTAEAKAIAEANNRFALAFYRELAKEPGNVIYSPLSLHAALSMTAAGAKGQTLAEMRQVLHLPDAPAADAGYRDLLGRVSGERPGYRLRTANVVWGQSGYPWQPAFAARLKDGFGSGIQEADFIRQPEAERVRINTWAENETDGRIKDLIAEGMLDRTYRMVLANAIYFKGQWAEQFDPKRTRPAPFTLADGTKVNVPMMSREGGFRVFAERTAGQWQPDFWSAELPYKGGETSMVLLVPGKPDGLPALENKLTPEALAGWLAAMHDAGNAYLSLPKFKIETAGPQYQHNSRLSKLGMPAAFIDGKADFTEMTTAERLFIGFVVQKAFVEVNEEGTEAAAATAVGMKAVSAPPSYQADRPFLFLIRHQPTGAILFIGRYEKP
ncbi:MAG: serpin family protein [Gemmataceae bacterium]